MRFKLRKIGVIVAVLTFVYALLWWHLNEAYLGHSLSDVLVWMNGSGTGGYSSLLAYGTYYCLIFLIFSNIIVSNENVIEIARMKNRLSFIRLRNVEIIISSIIFSTIIIGINVIFTSMVLRPVYLIERGFYIASLFQYFAIILFYWWVGVLFQLIFDIFNNKVIALLSTFLLISALYFVGLIYVLVWTPLKDMMLYEQILASGSSNINLLIVYARQLILVVVLYNMSKKIFIEKDIFENEK